MDDVLVATMVTLGILTISVFVALLAEWVCLEGAFRLMAIAAPRTASRSTEMKPQPAKMQAPSL